MSVGVVYAICIIPAFSLWQHPMRKRLMTRLSRGKMKNAQRLETFRV
jgi:hypothetical protein